MLPDRTKRLLSAYVDGELTHAEQAEVKKLLKSSEPARLWVQQLVRDASLLRRLPRTSPDEGLADRIMQRAEGLPRPRRRLPSRHRFRLSIGWSVAAAVLLVAFLANSREPVRPHSSLTSSAPMIAKSSIEPEQPFEAVATNAAEPVNEAAPLEPRGLTGASALPSSAVAKNDGSVSGDLVGPPAPAPALSRASDIAVRVSLDELTSERGKEKVLVELSKVPAFLVTLDCREASPALDRLQSAFRQANLGFAMEQEAMHRLRLRERLGGAAVILDNMQPQHVVQLLTQLRHEDRRHHFSKNAPLQFHQCSFQGMDQLDRDALAPLLQMRLQGWDDEPANGDSSKEIPGFNRTDRPNESLEPASLLLPNPPTALGSLRPPTGLLVYLPANGERSVSPELRQFIAQRAPTQPGTVSLCLKLKVKRS